MTTLYCSEDDILVIRLSDSPVTREESQGWNVNVSYDAAGSLVEIVVLDAGACGVIPLEAASAV